jgi:hypothetical protein
VKRRNVKTSKRRNGQTAVLGLAVLIGEIAVGQTPMIKSVRVTAFDVCMAGPGTSASKCHSHPELPTLEVCIVDTNCLGAFDFDGDDDVDLVDWAAVVELVNSVEAPALDRVGPVQVWFAPAGWAP